MNTSQNYRCQNARPSQNVRPTLVVSQPSMLSGTGRRSFKPTMPQSKKTFHATKISAAADAHRNPADPTVPPVSAPTEPVDSQAWAPLNGRTAVIAGAGPAGCTLAMYLARAGWRVRVFEKRPEPGPASTSRQRSWVLTLYPRGIRPVKAVAEVPLLRERAYKGLVLLPSKPGGKPTVLERTGVLMDRTLLATSLLDAARWQYGSRVEFNFSAPLERVDFVRRTAAFAVETSTATAAAVPALVGVAAAAAATAAEPANKPAAPPAAPSLQEVPYDLLVGADGSGSTLRSLMAAAFPGQYDTKVLSAAPTTGASLYKTLQGLPPLPEVQRWDPDSGADSAARLKGEFFFVLPGGSKGFVCICRDIDGSYCGYMASSEEVFGQMRRKEDYLALLPQCGPQLPSEWLPLMADKLLAAPVSTFPIMRSLSRFWAPGGVVLVGDAAHTVTPALGQGLNSALQDCELLAGELAGLGQDWSPDTLDAALRHFSEVRAPEVRALQELELIQGAALSKISWVPSDPRRLLPLLARKWIVLQYSGVALLGTVAATILGASEGQRRRKQQQQQQQPGAHAVPAGVQEGSGEQRTEEEEEEEEEEDGSEAAASKRADVLAAQMDATYVRSPPMYELLKGHMSYRSMLLRVYGLAAVGTGCTAALLYGLATAVAALVAPVLRV